MIKLKELRAKVGITQKELASLLGVGQSSISDYEAGKIEMPYEVMLKIADKFNITLDELFGRKIVNGRALTESQRDLIELIINLKDYECGILKGFALKLEEDLIKSGKLSKDNRRKLD